MYFIDIACYNIYIRVTLLVMTTLKKQLRVITTNP